MKLSILIIFSYLIIQVVFNWSVLSEQIENSLAKEDHLDTQNAHHLLLDCQHSDYRTYIKCLKRQKRHHGHLDYHNKTGDNRFCLDDCGLEQCTSHKCVHDCHTRCLKKTKETTQIITSYETECTTGDCNKDNSFPITNITTNIDVNNNINTHGPPYPGGPHPGGPYPGGPYPGGPYPGGPGYPNNPPPAGPPLIPSVHLVPQFGFSLGPIGGCLYSMSWPCVQPNQQSGFDCSQCANPFFKYKCDSWCFNGDVPNPRTTFNQTACRPPQCVGGIY